MSIKKSIQKTLLGKILIAIKAFFEDHILPERIHVKRRFKKSMGKRLDLKNPSTLNEKINWLKLYDRRELHTVCADKLGVRDYIEEQIGSDFLIPLYFKTNSPADIKPENLPDSPFILKTNHDSGGGIIIRDKSEVEWDEVRKKLKKRLAKNYYPRTKEWQYKNISPVIIAEKLLVQKNGSIPEDYKIHVFHGKARMIQVDIGRGTDNHFRNWYNTNWEREPYKWSAPKGNGKFTDPSDEEVACPITLDQMIELSEKLAEPFVYVRIDWYEVDGKNYFGEITFHHDGGYQPILPEKYDKALGDLIDLTKVSN